MLEFYREENKVICGIDEAGRGCIAGPVVAAAVILPDDFSHPLLNDSKKLSEEQRNLLRPLIESAAIAFGVGIVDNKIVDEINILQATYRAMHLATDRLKVLPDLLLIDGNRFRPYKNIAHKTIIKGDGKYMQIAAASVLAKTYRDEMMERLHLEFPAYNWQKNKGYPTLAHRAVVKELGSCRYHRQTFQLLKPEQLTIF
jgi:ribonuclease HII